jgi:tRNA A37 threonylcarbamoyladenosine dehydratase
MHAFHRTELLVGTDAWERLKAARMMVVGLGGVGSYAAEALARAGVGHLTLVDFDDVCITNLNRQLHATRRTVGASKAALMGERARAINPKATVVVEPVFYEADTSARLLGPGYDVVVDAIDNVTAKIHLLDACWRAGTRVVSAMGAGGRTDPTRVRVTDLAATEKDPFARVVRRALLDRGYTEGIEAVWTDEEPNDLDPDVEAAFRCICPGDNDHHTCDDRNVVQGSVPWIPSMFGMMAAGTAVNRLLGRPVLSSDRLARQRRAS